MSKSLESVNFPVLSAFAYLIKCFALIGAAAFGVVAIKAPVPFVQQMFALGGALFVGALVWVFAEVIDLFVTMAKDTRETRIAMAERGGDR